MAATRSATNRPIRDAMVETARLPVLVDDGTASMAAAKSETSALPSPRVDGAERASREEHHPNTSSVARS